MTASIYPADTVFFEKLKALLSLQKLVLILDLTLFHFINSFFEKKYQILAENCLLLEYGLGLLRLRFLVLQSLQISLHLLLVRVVLAKFQVISTNLAIWNLRKLFAFILRRLCPNLFQIFVVIRVPCSSNIRLNYILTHIVKSMTLCHSWCCLCRANYIFGSCKFLHLRLFKLV